MRTTTMAVNKERLDVALVRRGLAPSRERARALIMAGKVLVAGHLVDKPGTLISLDAVCSLKEAPNELKYVSRGGLNLEKALATFGLNPEDVVALDVGQGQLAWTLRNDPRVVVMEHTNIRYLRSMPEPMQCATIDVSFISLRLVLPTLVPLLNAGSWVVALVKPQFEAGKIEVDRGGGIISDPAVHQRVLQELREWIPQHTLFQILGLTDSPLYGRDGNREYLFHLSLG